MIQGKRVYIIGIGGTGMSPIALVLHEMGAVVSGSDRKASEYSEHLESLGIRVYLNQVSENIANVDLVLYTSAVNPEHPELAEALRQGIPVYKRSEFLSMLLEGRDVIAVAGTHGKSTTTAMAAYVLRELQMDPGFIIGSVSKDLGTNASAGKGAEFVIEADEYDRMFHGLYPKTAILTRVEYDHPDCYPTLADYFESFRVFLSHTVQDGQILLNADDPNQKQFEKELSGKVLFYGISQTADFRAENLRVNSKGCYSFECFLQGQKQMVDLSIPGKHNVYNALAVLAACSLHGVDLQKAAEVLETYHGIGRRFEITEEWNGITLVDDYAHHPTEISATLSAARDVFSERRLIVVWQPHTFSRTKELLADFAQSFDQADLLILTDIFAAREKQTDFGIEDVMSVLAPKKPVLCRKNADVIEYLTKELRHGDVVLTCSAGDANLAAPAAVNVLKGRANEAC